ncbi:MAG: HAMP domain-containing protein [Solirubrobacterales bacterium]|nr:HAMP domain-containing protein [Solirubrobacterales bacterium]
MPPRIPALAGLRGRLIFAVGLVVLATLVIAFSLVYHQTGTELRSQLNSNLRSEAHELARSVAAEHGRSPDQVLKDARSYASSQPYQNAAVLLFTIVPGSGCATNHPELFGRDKPEADESWVEQSQENTMGRRLAEPHAGFSSLPGPDVGKLAIYQEPVTLGSHVHAYFGAAEPLAGIARARSGVLDSFLWAGLVALAVALAFAYLIGARISAPLRDASSVARRIDAGDLSPRIAAPPRASYELGVLTDAFNHMLDRLQLAFDSQREFVADASHELRTPLTVIRGQLDLLAGDEQVSAEELQRVEQLVQAEIARITRVTDDLLLLAQSDTADFLHRRTVKLRPFITDLWDGMSLTTERRFETGPLPDVDLSVDPDRLAQALRNLAGNAINHTKAPDGSVRIDGHISDHTLTLAVSDDGPGIPAEQRSRVFERFFRTDPARSRANGGAGLGLAIVRAIAEAHGGSVGVSESDAGGARFVLALPL